MRFTKLYQKLLKLCWDYYDKELSPKEIAELAFVLGQVWGLKQAEGRPVSEIELPFRLLQRATGTLLVEP